jgi:hypothetical protein
VSRELRSSDPAAAISTLTWTVPHPISSYLWREGWRCQECDLSPSTAGCGSRRSRNVTKGPIVMQALPALRSYEAQLRTCTPVRRVWGIPPLVSALSLGRSPSAVALESTTRRTRGLYEMERGEGGFCKATTLKGAITALPQAILPPRKRSGSNPLLGRWTWARGGATSSEGACCQCHHSFLYSQPNPSSHGGTCSAKSDSHQ